MKNGSWLAGLGLIGACALCCALPLIGGLAALGVSSFFLSPFVLAGLAVLLIAAGVVIYQRRKAIGSSCMNTGCHCNSCSTRGA